MPSRCASRSQIAFSSVALAMRLPRTCLKMCGHSPPCCGDSRCQHRAQLFDDHLPGGVGRLAEKNGRSPAVHSPQPVSPSDRISASKDPPVRVTPKLVSNGRTRGRCSSRRIIASILIGYSDSFECQIQSSSAWLGDPVRRLHFLPHPAQSQVRPILVRKCLLKLPPVLQLNSQSSFPPGLPKPSTGRWTPEPDYSFLYDACSWSGGLPESSCTRGESSCHSASRRSVGSPPCRRDEDTP